MYNKNRKGQLSRREQAIANNASHRFFAGAAPDQDRAQQKLGEVVTTIKPKREIRRPVDGKPIHASEHQEQSAVISWWWLAHKSYNLPPFALFAVPNGGARDAITGSRLKAEGVRRGALDLILAKPSGDKHGLFIEMKVGDNKPTPEQKDYIDYLLSVGYEVSVHWNADSAISAIKSYLAL